MATSRRRGRRRRGRRQRPVMSRRHEAARQPGDATVAVTMNYPRGDLVSGGVISVVTN